MSAKQERATAALEKAQALTAAGFQNEARRKDALFHLSSAYAGYRELVNDAVWNAIRDKGEALEKESWDLGLPYELHNLRQKHTDFALKHAPDTETMVLVVKRLKDLRDEWRAMPITPKVKPPVVIQPGDRTQTRGHCQCCGRDHAVVSAQRMAKHGYEVKDRGNYGYFNGVCPGQHHKPMELDRAHTDLVATSMREEAVRCRTRAAELKSGKVRPAEIELGHGQNKRKVPFAAASEYEQRQAIQSAMHHASSQAHYLDSDANTLQELATRHHGQPLQIVKVS